MSKRKDVIFVRINGRVVPIKRREAAIGAAEVGAAGAVSYGSGRAAAKLLKKSNEFYRSSALQRGFSKAGTSSVHAGLRTAAAKNFIRGRKFAFRSKWTLLGGAALSGLLAGAAADRVAPKADPEKKALFATAAPILAGLVFNKSTKLARIALRAPFRESVKGAFAAYSKRGQEKTRRLANFLAKRPKQMKLDF